VTAGGGPVEEQRREGVGEFPTDMGLAIEPGAVRGYYVDLRLKAARAGWPPAWLNPGSLWVNVAQWGLGSFDRHVLQEQGNWLEYAVAVADYLLEHQDADGGWSHGNAYKHTYRLDAGWRSAMGQGEGASLLVRVAQATGEERYAAAARRAVAAFPEARLGSGPFPEEYPTSPPSFVLNGGIFAIWGLYDVWRGLGDEGAGARFEERVQVLAANLGRWDLGWWSRYDLFPHPVPNVASPSYHRLHIVQLSALHLLAPNDVFSETAARWERYAQSEWARRRTIAQKVAFRIAVPRNRDVARRLPWSPFFRS
jgi:heparosan-N-sulfate-glucuronate 5-epimerase